VTAPARSRLELVGAAALFSTAGAAIKASALSGLQIAGLRSVIAALMLWLLLPEARRRWTWRAALVAVAQAATFVLFVASNKLTTAASGVYIQATYPVWIVLFGPLLLGEPVRRRDLGFLAAAGLGLGLFFVGAEAPVATAPDPLLGNLMAACSSVSLALQIMGLRWLARDPQLHGTPATSVMMGHALAALVCLPHVLASPIGPRDLAVVGYLGLFQSGLAHVFLVAAIPHVAALEAALILYVEPALSPLWAFLVHGERPGPLSIAGGLLILAATAVWTAAGLARRPRWGRRPPERPVRL
jgi:drug/metabolite transporter (DMT)-like permease